MVEQNALRRHPELAQLCTLHYAGRMAQKALSHSRTVGPPLLLQPLVGELDEAISRVVEAVDRYRQFLEYHRESVLLARFPDHWSDEQVDAVMAVLCEMADRFHRSQADAGAASAACGTTRPR